MCVQVGDEVLNFDVVLLGTGSGADCTALPLIQNLLEKVRYAFTVQQQWLAAATLRICTGAVARAAGWGLSGSVDRLSVEE